MIDTIIAYQLIAKGSDLGSQAMEDELDLRSVQCVNLKRTASVGLIRILAAYNLLISAWLQKVREACSMATS